MNGYGGAMLHVDLGTRSVRAEPFGEAFARAWLGGNGFAVNALLGGGRPLADPLAAENTLVVAVGPFAGTPVWGSSRGTVGAISPQTGFFADSSFGGDFPHAQKLTGFDAIVVTGASPEPVYLVVGDHGAALRSAADLWGATTFETVERIREREGRDAVPAVIGPAGEHGVAFASILFAGRRHGLAGRCGMGAVMGAKQLKAIVVRGARPVTLHDPDGLRRFLAERLASLRKNTAWLTNDGTSWLVDMVNSAGMLGTRNDTRETFEAAGAINAGALREGFAPKSVACRGCPVACGKAGSAAGGSARVVKLPEYETLYALGSMLDNPDLASIVDMNELCDRYGLDTVTMGATLSFAAECLEKGAVTAADLGGEVRFGDGRAAVGLVRATAYREGIGGLLALGSAGMARRLGRGTDRFLYTAKGLEIPGHSARGVQSMALGYATATRGGSHHDTRPNYAAPYDGTRCREPRGVQHREPGLERRGRLARDLPVRRRARVRGRVPRGGGRAPAADHGMGHRHRRAADHRREDLERRTCRERAPRDAPGRRRAAVACDPRTDPRGSRGGTVLPGGDPGLPARQLLRRAGVGPRRRADRSPAEAAGYPGVVKVREPGRLAGRVHGGLPEVLAPRSRSRGGTLPRGSRAWIPSSPRRTRTARRRRSRARGTAP